MADICTWTGKSGQNYIYYVSALPPNFNESQPGNYIFAKKNSENRWVPIYIGETSDLGERFEDHHKMSCIKRKGATHIHAHLNHGGEIVRKNEEKDLLALYGDAWEPSGCNG